MACIFNFRIIKLNARNLVTLKVNFCLPNKALFKSHLKGFLSENNASMLHIMTKMQNLINMINVIKSITERKFNYFP